MTMNYVSKFCRLVKPVGSSSLSSGTQNVFRGSVIGMFKQYHDIPLAKVQDESGSESESEAERFSLIDANRVRRNLVFDRWIHYFYDRQVLGPGMVLFKNYLTHMGQVDIVNICQKGAMGPGGFYKPRDRSGAKLQLHMMCFGRNWDPATGYEKRYRSDGSEPPLLPYELISLADHAIKDAQWHLHELPSMCPDICVANFYSFGDRLGLHQDCDDSPNSIRRGLPVISIFIGTSAEFLYGDTEDENQLNNVLVESGDVLIFGGKSRLTFHGVKGILLNSSPSQLLQETGLKLGCLNLTIKQTRP